MRKFQRKDVFIMAGFGSNVSESTAASKREFAMVSRHGFNTGSLLIVHGGAGPQDPSAEGMRVATAKLLPIAQSAAALLARGESSMNVVLHALRGMEDEPHFNAGMGSALQADAQARLTASLMDGKKQRFSGVINVQNVKNPSVIAAHLQNSSSRVVAQPGCEMLARELSLPVTDVVTPARLQRWLETRPTNKKDGCDTVGCVVWDGNDLAAGTSTGGRGQEIPGRVSDSATIAGNYASASAAVSATGVGEEIVEDALAARLETRVRDGMTLEVANQRCLREAEERQRSYGWIAIDHSGCWAIAHNTPAMTYIVINARGEVLASS